MGSVSTIPEDAASVIIRHVGDVEAALLYTHDKLDPVFGREVAAFFEAEAKARRWAGKFDWEQDDDLWAMPPGWRTTIEGVDREEDGWFSITYICGQDGRVNETHLANFLGVGADGNMSIKFGQQLLRVCVGTHPERARRRVRSMAEAA